MTCPNWRGVILRKLFVAFSFSIQSNIKKIIIIPATSKNKTKQSSRSPVVCRLTLLFPLRDSVYATVAGTCWSLAALEKNCQQKVVSLFSLGQEECWTRIFSLANVCRLQMKTSLFSIGKGLQSKIACRGRKPKIKDWLYENTCSFLPFKKEITDVVTSYRRIWIN